MSERQQKINTDHSRLSRTIHSKPLLYSAKALFVGGVAGAAIWSGGHAKGESQNPYLDNGATQHVLQIKDVKTTFSSEARLVDAKRTVKVAIEKKGESLTEATARVTGSTVQDAFEILKENNLDKNNLVYVDDEFNVDVSGDVKTEGAYIAPDSTQVNTGTSSESSSANKDTGQVNAKTDSAPSAPATNTDESPITQEPTSTPDNPQTNADLKASNVQEPTAEPTNTQQPTASPTSVANANVKGEVSPTPTTQAKTTTDSPLTGISTQITTSQQNTTSTGCIETDLKGHFDFIDADKNIVGNPSRLHLENVQPADRQDCPDNVWIRSFGSTQNPYSSGWLENQAPITSQITIHNSNGSTTLTSTAEGMVTIPNNTNDLGVDINVTDTRYCWVQIEAVRTDSLDPKVYSGVNMINYGLYSNPNMDPVTCQQKPTVTPTTTSTSTPEPTSTSTLVPTNTPEAGCIDSDVKGELNDLEDSNHLTGRNVTGKVSNIAKNSKCSNDIFIHMYGSMKKPTGTGQNIGLDIESQKGNHILTQKITVPENTIDMPIQVTIPQNKFCSVQVDLTTDGVIKEEPRYIDNDFLIYVDEENCNPKTSTSTPSNTPTRTVTFTATNTPVPPTETSTPLPTNTLVPTDTPTPRIVVMRPPDTGSGPENSNRKNILIWAAMAATASIASFAAARRAGKSKDMLRQYSPVSPAGSLVMDEFDILEDNIGGNSATGQS